MKAKLRGKGGLISYLGTNDAREVEKMIEEGNKEPAIAFVLNGCSWFFVFDFQNLQMLKFALDF